MMKEHISEFKFMELLQRKLVI